MAQVERLLARVGGNAAAIVAMNSILDRSPADTDADFKELFEKIDWFPPPIMLAAEVRSDRFALLSDFICLGLEAEGASSGFVPLIAEADLKTRSCLGDSAFS